MSLRSRIPIVVASVFVLVAGAVMILRSDLGRPSFLRGDPGSAERLGRDLLRQLPLSFIENQGQAWAPARYYVQGSEPSMFFTRHGLTLGLNEEARLDLRFINARPSVPEGVARAPGVVSYFRGDPEDWTTGVTTYSRVAYRDLWPGIDVVYSATGSRLKYSFLVSPGADPSAIALEWRGASEVETDERGRLVASTPAGRLIDDVPYAYQELDGRRVEVPSSYQLGPGSSFRFRLSGYDPARPLVIDPAILLFSGFIGGDANDDARDVAVDPQGDVYVVGQTYSDEATFPDGDGFGAVGGGDHEQSGATDAFVVKIDSSGTRLIYAAYVGGTGDDDANAVAVDAAGNAFIIGGTDSTTPSFPETVGPDLDKNSPRDVFVAKVNAAGTSLDYAGFIGGTDNAEDGTGIAVDDAGNAYVAGRTDSDQASFPDGDGFGSVPGPDQVHNSPGGTVADAWVAKVNPAGTGLVYAGYIGGAGVDEGESLAMDPAGNVYLSGFTASTEATFPDGDGFGAVPGFDPTQNGPPGSDDAWVAKVNPTGSGLAYASFIGGGDIDRSSGVAVDQDGSAYVTGDTLSNEASFPDGDGFGAVPGLDQTHNSPGVKSDAYLVKLNAAGTGLVHAGFLGGTDDDGGRAVAVDGAGSAYVFGNTLSSDFPVLLGPDTTHNSATAVASDVFVTKVAPSGTALVYSGFIGGSDSDTAVGPGDGLALDEAANAYVAGATYSGDFPAAVGPDITFNGVGDGFVAKVETTEKCQGKLVTQLGSNKKDTIIGTSLPDVVKALGGKDTVKTKAGKDRVCAGKGKDTVKGGSGKDRLKGEAGNDTLNGGPKADTCVGGAGKDKGVKCERGRL